MTKTEQINALIFDPLAYTIKSLDDEIRVDKLCRELLQHFHQNLLQNHAPLVAGSKAAGADYFLRDFIIDHQRSTVFDLSASHVRSFAGNWYIISNLEPNIKELEELLAGVADFCLFSAKLELTPADQANQAIAACRELDFYKKRIDDFFSIIEDGFSAWNAACPLKG
jgi:hypothetical protein